MADRRTGRFPRSRSSTTTARRGLPRRHARARRHAEHRRAAAPHRGRPPFTILDFGCGPGRDLPPSRRWATSRSASKAPRASSKWPAPTRGARSGTRISSPSTCPTARFDGVFANASLFHVPGAELPRILRQLRATLKPGGVLFSSNPRGANEEGWNRGRYGAYHDPRRGAALMTEAGFVELEHYYRPAGLPREQQPWLASVWRATIRNNPARAPGPA